MSIDASFAVSIASAIIALLSLLEARRLGQITRLSLRQQSYEKIVTLPSVETLGVVEIAGKTRAKLIVFNERDTPYRVNCVKCYRYDPKPRNLSNWINSFLGPFDWDYSREEGAFWNPKGTLDDDEHYSDKTLPFTLVKEKEILLVTLEDFRSYRIYRFEVITSQGTARCEGVLPTGRTSLPHEHSRRIS
ncbi:hypothetical protein [Delftia sp. RIT313]|uniref:hypothetical protein n=1 Tax=Delftia sp. RIT313 TaxID=1468410 RepID=UPI0012692449|nr:hypothetical protein [Delftia sp. RIT313]